MIFLLYSRELIVAKPPRDQTRGGPPQGEFPDFHGTASCWPRPGQGLCLAPVSSTVLSAHSPRSRLLRGKPAFCVNLSVVRSQRLSLSEFFVYF